MKKQNKKELTSDDVIKNRLGEKNDNIKNDMHKKVDIFKHKDLEFRVEKIEEKVEITRKK